MMESCLVIGFPEYEQQAQALADQAGLPYQSVRLHRFPDGESQLFLPESLAKHLVIVRSLNQPNEKLVELVLLASSARQAGVETITLVAPYLCYMRQDKVFHPGEVVSQRVIGELLARYFDNVITVDAHLHRVHTLIEAIPTQNAINITANKVMASFLSTLENPFLIGPDEESEQWVADIAALDSLDFTVAKKQRLGDREVKVSLPKANYQGRHIVIVDDMVSTGKTILAVAQLLKSCQLASLSVLVTHALFSDDVLDEFKAAGIDHIWSCDSIPHSSNAISLSSALAEILVPISKD